MRDDAIKCKNDKNEVFYGSDGVIFEITLRFICDLNAPPTAASLLLNLT